MSAAASAASRTVGAGTITLPRLAGIAALLDRTSMYRLLLYYLAGILLAAMTLGAFGLLSSSPLDIAATALLLVAVTVPTHLLLARLFSVPSSLEPTLITALILALIASPVSLLTKPLQALPLAFAGVVAIASKFLIAPRRQHIFNPAAFGIYAAGMLFHEYSTWWVGNAALLPFVALGGLLVVRKVGRLRIVGLFLTAFTVFLTGFTLIQGVSVGDAVAGVGFVLVRTELLFFAVVMLTEPITSPKRFVPQALHASLVALLMLPQLTVLGVTFSPEAALLVGNLFSRIVSRSARFVLPFRGREKLARGVYAFNFDLPSGLRHRTGQYMEWVLPLAKGDNRGNRRSLTISSSPTEPVLSFAVRVPERPSAYKRALMELEPGATIVAAELSGDFVLPATPGRPLALIAGGIGITPFRSMLRYLVDRSERRDITLIYSTFGPDEIAFREDLEQARRDLGVKVVYTLTDPERVPPGWGGRVGFVDARLIAEEVADYGLSLFYISGPPAMVKGVKSELRTLGVRSVKTDFFPGYSM